MGGFQALDAAVPDYNGGLGDYACIQRGEAGEVVLMIVRLTAPEANCHSTSVGVL